MKETLALDSADEYRFTGTETRPKEMVALEIERAGMGVLRLVHRGKRWGVGR